ncbi:MAG: hypothetical protein G8D58_04060 [gamma proteobacterium symbiont of Phacoides pectinatus]
MPCAATTSIPSAATPPLPPCLLPLIEALGRQQFGRELVEALPHFVDEIDLVELRNILVVLGYETTPSRARLEQIRPELYPAIFVGDQGEVLVLIERSGDDIRYFDAVAGCHKEQRAQSIKGTAYLITDTHQTHSSSPKSPDEPWFTRLMRRFQGLLWHLFAMSFLINIIALAVPLFIMMVYDKVIGAGSIETLPMMLAG